MINLNVYSYAKTGTEIMKLIGENTVGPAVVKFHNNKEERK